MHDHRARAMGITADDASPAPTFPTDEALSATLLACRFCRDAAVPPLPHEPRPILRLSRTARLLVASQAPGVRAHASGVPFNDPSGERLRAWMGLAPADFYDARRVAIVPMGFCFPGHDALKGDLPPRRECRALWHDRVFAAMPQVETILAIGLYAIRFHCERLGYPIGRQEGLGAVVARWRDFSGTTRPRLIPLPHPSWRNSAWLKRNLWFEAEVLPVVRSEVARLVLDAPGVCSEPVQPGGARLPASGCGRDDR